jgi:hypothetical protein
LLKPCNSGVRTSINHSVSKIFPMTEE